MATVATHGNYGDILFRLGDYNKQTCSGGDVSFLAKNDTTLFVGHPPGGTKNELFQISAGQTLTIKNGGDIEIS